MSPWASNSGATVFSLLTDYVGCQRWPDDEDSPTPTPRNMTSITVLGSPPWSSFRAWHAVVDDFGTLVPVA
ncbi:hypothetical protein GCM10025795_02600 [Verticiella sediminum]